MKDKFYERKILKKEETETTFTVYEDKMKLNVILRTYHLSIDIESNEKKTLEIVGFYNETKGGVLIIGQMPRNYSVKCIHEDGLCMLFTVCYI